MQCATCEARPTPAPATAQPKPNVRKTLATTQTTAGEIPTERTEFGRTPERRVPTHAPSCSGTLALGEA